MQLGWIDFSKSERSKVMRRLEPVLTVLNPLKCGELVQVFTMFYG